MPNESCSEPEPLSPLVWGPQEPLVPGRLSAFQRVMLATDGTVTDILGAYLGERITIRKLRHSQIVASSAIPYLDVLVGTSLVEREVLLKGATSGRVLVYAASIIVPDRLTAALRDRLLSTSEPIGRLMIEERTETFREVLHQWHQPAGAIAVHFGLHESAAIVARTYRIFSGGRPIILIAEKFAETSFTS